MVQVPNELWVWSGSCRRVDPVNHAGLLDPKASRNATLMDLLTVPCLTMMEIDFTTHGVFFIIPAKCSTYKTFWTLWQKWCECINKFRRQKKKEMAAEQEEEEVEEDTRKKKNEKEKDVEEEEDEESLKEDKEYMKMTMEEMEEEK